MNISPEQRLLADALVGDRSSLERLAADPAAGEIAHRHRLSPALAVQARRLGLDGPAVAVWRRALMASAGFHLQVEERLAIAAAALADAGVVWAPLKGCDLATRIYAQPEERPLGDADLLIFPEDYPRARAALERAGWRSLAVGRRVERYLEEEGYAWQAVDDGGGVVLEIHVRLWGLVPEALGPTLLSAAVPDPRGTGRRLTLPAAWLVAAIHGWLSPPPRPLLGAWDLHRIAALAEPDFADQLVGLAEGWELQLPAGLAAARTAALWDSPPNLEISRRLLRGLARPERLAAGRALARGADALGLGPLVLSRLLAGRPSRAGWRSLPRQVWAHPGVVEQETLGGRSWPARRLSHVFRVFRKEPNR